MSPLPQVEVSPSMLLEDAGAGTGQADESQGSAGHVTGVQTCALPICRQRSNRRIDEAQQAHYVQLVRTHYAGFGPQLAHEYLAREHGSGFSVARLPGRVFLVGFFDRVF